jgi:hypothetical protein
VTKRLLVLVLPAILLVGVLVGSAISAATASSSVSGPQSLAGPADAGPDETPTQESEPTGSLDATDATLQFAGQVNPSILPRPARRLPDSRSVPFQTPGDVQSLANAPEATTIDSAAGVESLASSSIGTSFDGLDSLDNSPIMLHPPDTQLAVGPNHVFEMTNIMGRIFQKNGTVASTFTLASFFGVPAGWFDFDPKVIYDAESGRFRRAEQRSRTPPHRRLDDEQSARSLERLLHGVPEGLPRLCRHRCHQR